MFTYNNVRKNRFGIVVFTVLLILSILFIKQKQHENEELLRRYELARNTVPPAIYDNMKGLKEKLLSLEFENSVRTQELLHLRRKLKDKFVDNSTEGNSLSLPSIYNSLPHLLGHKDALSPSLHLTKHRKNVNLAFGVPTVRREHPYLYQTILSMITGLNDEEKQDVIIIVFIGELNEEYVNEIVTALKEKFREALDTGLLEVISPSRNFYPSLDNLPSTFNDPPKRVKWRSKQNLDYAYLMMYAQSRAAFYVQMEDDIIATPGYASTILAFAMQQSNNNWFMLEFSSLGFIGKTFHASDLYKLVEFFMIYYKDKPNDWLLDHVLWVKICNPETDNKRCNKEKEKLRIRFKPSLFQHVGKMSSLKGKKQNLVDKEFKKALLFHAHLNPKAIVKTDLEEYQTYTALRGYLGHSFLWALNPKKDQVLRISFLEAVKLKSFIFRTGNPDHPGDILVNATVEGITKDVYKQRKLTGETSKDISSPFAQEDYITLGHFDKDGLASIKADNDFEPLGEIRLRVLADVKDHWVVFSEFFIESV